jgi:hypothetical protein
MGITHLSGKSFENNLLRTDRHEIKTTSSRTSRKQKNIFGKASLSLMMKNSEQTDTCEKMTINRSTMSTVIVPNFESIIRSIIVGIELAIPEENAIDTLTESSNSKEKMGRN